MTGRLSRAAIVLTIIGSAIWLALPSWGETPPADLGTVISRYIAWRGGTAFLGLQTLHQTGEIETAGLIGTIDVWEDAAGRSRESVDLGAIKHIVAGDRNGGWRSSTAGQIESRPGTKAVDSWRETLIEFAGALTGGGAVPATLLPDESDDGRNWRVIRLSFGDDDHYDLFIDGETGKLDGYRIEQDRRSQFVHLSDWRPVNGVRIAWSQRWTTDVAARDVTIHLHAAEVNATPPPDWLTRPKDRHLVHFLAGDRTDFLPFEFVDTSRIFIPATVNGVATTLTLDTAAGTTVINRPFAQTLNLQGSGSVAVRGAGGTEMAQIAGGVSITLGTLTLDNITVAILPLADTEAAIGHPLPVILGKEILAETVAEVDFARHRIAFIRADAYTPSRRAVMIPLHIIEGGLRAVDISVEHDAPILAQFDLGSGSPLLLFPSYWMARNLKRGRRGTAFLDGGIGGMAPEAEISIRHLSVGGFSFEDVPTWLANAGLSAVDSTRVQANIGLPVFRRFRLAIDFAHDRLFVSPEPSLFNRPFEKDRTGLQIEPNQAGAIVRFVAPGSPAEAQGWQIGDQIAAVDGRKVTPHNLDWRLGEPGTTIKLDGADGAGIPFHRNLVLATFY